MKDHIKKTQFKDETRESLKRKYKKQKNFCSNSRKQNIKNILIDYEWITSKMIEPPCKNIQTLLPKDKKKTKKPWQQANEITPLQSKENNKSNGDLVSDILLILMIALPIVHSYVSYTSIKLLKQKLENIRHLFPTFFHNWNAKS